jgi:hypothetical protein
LPPLFGSDDFIGGLASRRASTLTVLTVLTVAQCVPVMSGEDARPVLSALLAGIESGRLGQFVDVR